jgi:hypothetical protein
MEPLSKSRPVLNFILAADEWIHNHTKLVKISRIALDMIGTSLIIAGFFGFSYTHLPLLIAGALIVLISELAFQTFKLAGFIAFDPEIPSFSEKTSLSKNSKLHYQNSAPILELNENTPFENGKAHGELMAPYIFKMLSRTRFTMKLFGMLHIEKIKKALPEIQKKIPLPYLEELRGLLEGMNEWDRKKSFFKPKPITLDELILFQLIPDMAHLTLSNMAVVGCTVVADKEKDGSFVFGRHLDWPSFGTYGSHTLLIKRKNTLSVSVPGLIGDLTVMNTSLFLTLNVCSPKIIVDSVETDKIPSIFLLRKIAETYTSVETLQKAIRDETLETPLVPFHANIMDEKSLITVHFRQQMDGIKPVIRNFERKKANTLYATYNDHHPTEDTKSHRIYMGVERENAGNTAYLANQEKTAFERVRMILKQRPINNHLTIHHVIYRPTQRLLTLRFDDSFAASGEAKTYKVFEDFSLNFVESNPK